MGKMTVGAELRGGAHTITEEKLVAFESVIWKRVANVHSDHAAAKAVGMSRVIASGQNQLAFLHRLLHNRFREGWTRGGTIAARWIFPVYVGDVITAGALVTAIREQDGRKRAYMEVWCENQSGARTALGKAEAYLDE